MTQCVFFRAFIDILCDDTVDVNKEYAAENFQTILQLSVDSEKYDFLKELLRHPSCDPNIPNKVIKKSPLHTAVESEKYDFVKELLRHPSCDPNIPNKVIEKCPLHTAVEKGNVPRPGCCWTVGQM